MKYLILTILLSCIFWTGSAGETTSSSTPYDYTEKNWPQTCLIGRAQTPVDLNLNAAQVVKNNSVISILSNDYKTINSGYMQNYSNQKFGLDLPGTDSLYVLKGGIKYQYLLLGFHMHVASEHTFGGMSTDMELHLVHGKNKTYLTSSNITDPDTNNYLVVGLLFKTNSTAPINTFLQKLSWDSNKNITGLELSQYVVPNKNFYHYPGSLTTPDCVEKVNWVVMDQVETMTVDQFSTIRNWIQKVYPNGNARTTKPLYGRTVYYIQNSGEYFRNSVIFAVILALVFIFA
jgi:carbonic anhydrase